MTKEEINNLKTNDKIYVYSLLHDGRINLISYLIEEKLENDILTRECKDNLNTKGDIYTIGLGLLEHSRFTLNPDNNSLVKYLKFLIKNQSRTTTNNIRLKYGSRFPELFLYDN